MTSDLNKQDGFALLGRLLSAKAEQAFENSENSDKYMDPIDGYAYQVIQKASQNLVENTNFTLTQAIQSVDEAGPAIEPNMLHDPTLKSLYLDTKEIRCDENGFHEHYKSFSDNTKSVFHPITDAKGLLKSYLSPAGWFGTIGNIMKDNFAFTPRQEIVTLSDYFEAVKKGKRAFKVIQNYTKQNKKKGIRCG